MTAGRSCARNGRGDSAQPYGLARSRYFLCAAPRRRRKNASKSYSLGCSSRLYICTWLQISDPRTEGGTLTSYTSYHISSTLAPDGVRRRYSDFDWLRDILVARYHGVAVPLMPEKRLVGNQSKGFIEERMQVRARAAVLCCSGGTATTASRRVKIPCL